MAAMLMVAGIIGRGASKEAPSPFHISFDSTAAQVQALLGAPDHVREERTFRVWDYNLGPADENDMGCAWSFFFEEPSGKLLSITHNVAEGVPMKTVFPNGTLHKVTSPAPANLPVLTGSIDGERVVIGIGITSVEQSCSQIIVMRRSALPKFYPWLSKQLN